MKSYKNLEKKAIQLLQNRQIVNYTNYSKGKGILVEVLDNHAIYDVFLSTQDTLLDECSCEDFDAYGTCAHIIAGEFLSRSMGWKRTDKNIGVFGNIFAEPKNKMQLYLETMEPIVLEKIHQDIRSTSANLSFKLAMRFEPDYRVHTDCYMHLYIGRDKLYLIKHVEQFLLAYFTKSEYKLTAKVTIDFQYEVFTKAVHQFLELIATTNYSRLYAVEKKYLPVSEEFVKPILRFLSQNELDYEVYFEEGNITLNHIQFGTDSQPLKTEIILKNEQYILNDLVKDVICLSDSELLLVDNYFYDLTPIQTQMATFCVREMSVGSVYLFHMSAEELQVFIRDMLPNLNDVLDVVNVADYQQENVVNTASISVYQENDSIHIALHRIENFKQNYLVHQVLYQFGFQKKANHIFQRENDSIEWLYNFLNTGIDYLKTIVSVTVSESLQNLILNVEHIDVAMSLESSLLNISFNIEGISSNEVIQLLNSIQEKQSFHRLDDGRVLSLQSEVFNQVHKVLHNIRGTYQVKNGALQLKKSNVLSVASEIDVYGATIPLQELIEDLKYPENMAVKIPKSLQATLKDYQVFGFKWLKMLSKHGLGGILADDMGLGKTIQTITFILSELEENSQKKFLIIAPASLVYNWQVEFRKFAPSIDVTVLVGEDHKNNKVDLSQLQSSVIITSYQSFRRYEKSYKKENWHTIVLDESQMVKNHTTKLHKSLRDFNINTIFALSGTPIENRKEEFWSIFALILPGLFPVLKAYKKLEDSDIVKISRPFILRRLKKDVLLELPDKHEIILYNELDKAQKLLYLGYLDKITQEISHYSNEELKKKHIEILSGITRLRQICCHPSLFVENYTGESGKFNQFLNLMTEKLDNGNRILVFSQFSSMLLLLQELLQSHQINSLMLTGQTPTKKRKEMVDQFNNGEVDVFFISLKAGGTGLNLTRADTVVLYDLWWNPAVEEQAMSRAHRMGQKNDVTVYRMVTQGTIEENILRLQQNKKDLFNRVVSNESEEFLQRNQLSTEDIKEILGVGTDNS